MTSDDSPHQAIVSEVVETLLPAISLSRGIHQGETGGAGTSEEALFEGDRDFLREANTDEAGGRHGVAVAYETDSIGGGDDLPCIRQAALGGGGQRNAHLALLFGSLKAAGPPSRSQK
jgi:hypothetical protein